MAHSGWDEQFLVNIEPIDRQHAYFLELLNRIAVEILSTDNAEYHQRLLRELGKYADFHFTSEENMMLSSEYPDTDRHIQIHIDLLSSFEAKSALFVKKQLAAEEIIAFLKDWFFNHTVTEDKTFGYFFTAASADGV